MRLTVAVLLAANILLFTYLFWQRADSEALGSAVLPKEDASPGVPSLVLANELLPEFAESSVLRLNGMSETAESGWIPCAVAGPIESRSRAVSVAGYIRSQGKHAQVAALIRPSHNGYQLFIGPMVSAASVESRRDELELMGLQADIVDDGGDMGLSLGLFASEEDASGTLDEVERLGLEADLKRLLLDEQEFWLILAWEDAFDTVSTSFGELKSIVPELEHASHKYCLRQSQ